MAALGGSFAGYAAARPNKGTGWTVPFWLSPVKITAHKLMLGEMIAHYQVLEKISQGGMGEVYLARDLRLNRQVALKFLPREWSRKRWPAGVFSKYFPTRIRAIHNWFESL